VYLQDEDEEVHRSSSLIQEVLLRAFVAVVELEFLDDVGVSEDPQEDLLCDLEGAEQGDLWGGGGHQQLLLRNNSFTYIQHFIKLVTITPPLDVSD